mmetsp:Transcript_90196/g.232839  ORF Transcript_90196/g.232839 Transcript_90196/m.232839 type:complete len:271 (-) Transcript_90196:705-1517(-)
MLSLNAGVDRGSPTFSAFSRPWRRRSILVRISTKSAGPIGLTSSRASFGSTSVRSRDFMRHAFTGVMSHIGMPPQPVSGSDGRIGGDGVIVAGAGVSLEKLPGTKHCASARRVFADLGGGVASMRDTGVPTLSLRGCFSSAIGVRPAVLSARLSSTFSSFSATGVEAPCAPPGVVARGLRCGVLSVGGCCCCIAIAAAEAACCCWTAATMALICANQKAAAAAGGTAAEGMAPPQFACGRPAPSGAPSGGSGGGPEGCCAFGAPSAPASL